MNRNLLFLSSCFNSFSPFFEMTIDTTKLGSPTDTFILPCGNVGTYNATIDWGDSSTSQITTYNDTDLTHVYSVGGIYQIKISGVLPWINFVATGDRLKVVSIDNWGSIPWYSFQHSFSGCSNMDLLATDAPDLSTNFLGSISQIFRNCTSISSIDMRSWDFSNVTNMGIMFNNSNATEINLTGLNTSNNTNLNQTFSGVSPETVIGLDTLNIENVTTFNNLFFSTKLSTVEYNKLLISWDNQNPINSLSVNFGSSQYTLGSASATARASLILTDLWTITDGGGI